MCHCTCSQRFINIARSISKLFIRSQTTPVQYFSHMFYEQISCNKYILCVIYPCLGNQSNICRSIIIFQLIGHLDEARSRFCKSLFHMTSLLKVFPIYLPIWKIAKINHIRPILDGDCSFYTGSSYLIVRTVRWSIMMLFSGFVSF